MFTFFYVPCCVEWQRAVRRQNYNTGKFSFPLSHGRMGGHYNASRRSCSLSRCNAELWSCSATSPQRRRPCWSNLIKQRQSIVFSFCSHLNLNSPAPQKNGFNVELFRSTCSDLRSTGRYVLDVLFSCVCVCKSVFVRMRWCYGHL